MALERIHNSMVDVQVDNFNTNQTDLGEKTFTAVNSDVYTTPASTRTLVYSILCTNTDSVARTVTCTLSDNSAGPAEYSLGYQIPLAAGTSIESLRKPKVLETSDKIRGLASLTNVVDVTVVGIPLANDTQHFNAGVNLTTTALTSLFTGTSNGQQIESLLLSNITALSTTATVTWTTNSGGLLIDWVKDLTVPANSTIEILDSPKAIATGDTIQVQSSIANSINAILSGRDK